MTEPLIELRFPALGADVTRATLVEWVKRAGDRVKLGDTVAIVDTRKGAVEIDALADGVIERLLVDVGAQLQVGACLAMIRRAAPEPARASVSEPPRVVAPAPPPSSPPAPPAPPLTLPPPPAHARLVPVSPRAQKLAADLAVDLTRIQGTGPNGAITSEDILRADRGLKPSAPAPTPPPPPPLPRATAPPPAAPPPAARAERSAPARASAPAMQPPPVKGDVQHHYCVEAPVDLSAALTWARLENERRSNADLLMPAALLVKATALALREVPELNGFWTEEGLRKSDAIHIGCAISSSSGRLVAPALLNVDEMDLGTLMKSLVDLVGRVRQGRVRSSELSAATITAMDFGDQGVDAAFAGVNAPQVAIIGFGKIMERPWASGGHVEARPVMTITLSADSRASDCRHGGTFLNVVDQLLQTPEQL
jgi:pyruvate dehydrogenase E2 component (dihydrolipoamide acetyltransferase)